MMRKYFLTTALVCTLGIAVPVQAKSTITPNPFAGAYVGMEAGYRYYSFDNASELNSNGLSYAGLLGYRFQLSPRVLLGVEGRVGGDSASKSIGVPAGGNFGVVKASVSSGVNWAASGLLGVATEKNLFFVSLGYGKTDLRASVLGVSLSSYEGGIRVGLGLEHKLNKRLAIRVSSHWQHFNQAHAISTSISLISKF